MAKIIVNNPRQVINGGAKKYYFKVKGLGGPKGDKGDKGDTGSQGPQGPQGNAATISVGSTTTLPVGYNATVENVGSIYNAVLNFGIPQGPQGPQGATGAKGDKGDKGEQGNPGPQGEKGTNATVTVGTTTTTEPGTQAYAWNSSSNPNNAVINFNIPRGATGPQGPQGVQGPTGPAGADGKSFTPVVVSSLPSTGDEGKLYLTPKNYTTGTATGNPITISLGEDAGQITSFQLDGNTYQQSYTGKNLLNLSASRDFTSGTDYSFDASSGVLTVTMSSAPAVNRYSGWRVTEITAGAKYTFSIESFTNPALSNTDRAIMIRSHNGTSATELATLNKTQTSYTFTAPNDSVRLDFFFYIASGDTGSTSIITKPMLEAGETATSYEPYMGGQASPNPDYPQPIQTVTGEQTVEIVGKNLIDPDGLELGNIDTSGNDSASQQVVRSGYIRVAAGNYTLKVNNSDNNINLWRYAIYDNSKTFVSANTPQAKSATITIANNGYIRVSFYNVPWKDLTVQEIIGSQVQLELGSTASAYAPYSKQTLPLDLGSLELCKLGTYQDYIYKDGDDWKVHKATKNTTIDGSEVWGKSGNTNNTSFYYASNNNPNFKLAGIDDASIQPSVSKAVALSNNFLSYATNIANTNAVGFSIDKTSTARELRVGMGKSSPISTVALFEAWLEDNNITLYFALATPTDTTITDQTLIAQLEAIRTASLQASNTISNTAAGSNLAGDMELGYYEYDPTNRYDKWLWLDLNNNYEKLGS